MAHLRENGATLPTDERRETLTVLSRLNGARRQRKKMSQIMGTVSVLGTSIMIDQSISMNG